MPLVCKICFEDAQQRDQARVTTCGHVFCQECARVWWQTETACPVCRKTIDLRHLITIFDQDNDPTTSAATTTTSTPRSTSAPPPAAAPAAEAKAREGAPASSNDGGDGFGPSSSSGTLPLPDEGGPSVGKGLAGAGKGEAVHVKQLLGLLGDRWQQLLVERARLQVKVAHLEEENRELLADLQAARDQVVLLSEQLLAAPEGPSTSGRPLAASPPPRQSNGRHRPSPASHGESLASLDNGALNDDESDDENDDDNNSDCGPDSVGGSSASGSPAAGASFWGQPHSWRRRQGRGRDRFPARSTTTQRLSSGQPSGSMPSLQLLPQGHEPSIIDSQGGSPMAQSGQQLTSVHRSLAVGGHQHHSDEWQLCSSHSTHSEPVHGIAVHQDGGVVATASWDQTCRLFDVEAGEVLGVLRGHSLGLYAVTFSAVRPDVVGTVSSDHTCRLWDMASCECLEVLRGHTDEVNGLSFQEGSPLLATASDDMTAIIWDSEKGEEVISLHGHQSVVYGVRFQPGGSMLATASFDWTAKLWDPRTGEDCQTLEGHSEDVIGVDFDCSGWLLATGSDDNTARVWDIRVGKTLAVLTDHGGEVKRVAFSSCGDYLATTSGDSTARIFETSRFKCLQVLSSHTDHVFDVAWSSSCEFVATASHDCSWKLWKPSLAS